MVAGVAAVVGRSFDLAILVAIADRAVGDVATGLDELVERAFVEPTVDSWYDFRHVLIRDVLESAVPLARRRELHARVAAFSVDRPDLGGAAYRSAHEEAAGNRRAAHTLALSAADQAASISNHREALALYRRAVRCAPADLHGERLAALLNARGVEAAATDDNATAAQDFSRAYQLLLDVDDAARCGRGAPAPGRCPAPARGRPSRQVGSARAGADRAVCRRIAGSGDRGDARTAQCCSLGGDDARPSTR